MTRSLLIIAVTVALIAALYYGFSRFAAIRAPAPNAAPIAAPGTGSPAAPATRSAQGSSSMSEATPAAAAATRRTDAASAQAATSPPVFTIVIDRARPPAPSDVIRVAKDDPVTLKITSDRAGHLEVHGYRQEVAVEPGKTATLSFNAERTGRFPIDLHAKDGAHVEVTALEVMPR